GSAGAAAGGRRIRRRRHPRVRGLGPARRAGTADDAAAGTGPRDRGPGGELAGHAGDNGLMTAPAAHAGKRAKDLNEVIRYTLWSVFRLREPLPEERGGLAEEVSELFEQLAAKDVTVRGTY